MAYFDCIVWKETKNGKKYAVKIGSAKQRDDGGFYVDLDANPLDGKFTISPQRQRDSQPGNARAPNHSDNHDEIPF